MKLKRTALLFKSSLFIQLFCTERCFKASFLFLDVGSVVFQMLLNMQQKKSERKHSRKIVLKLNFDFSSFDRFNQLDT